MNQNFRYKSIFATLNWYKVMKIESKFKFSTYSALAFAFIVLLIFSMLIIPDKYIDNDNRRNFRALAQASATPSPGQLKVLIDNSIQTLKSGDINGTITRLKAAEQELGAIPKNNENYPSVQVVLTLLVTDVIKSLGNGDNSEALIYLNLAEQHTFYLNQPKNSFIHVKF